jgi:uncharacterized protein YndB with AHSA1/START domain
MTEVAVERFIAAPPRSLYDLVSDVTSMGRWSPETTGCRWLGDATGPAVGARFKGANQAGWRRWSTTCTVTEADAGRRFTFAVDVGPVGVSTWSYDFVAEGEGCRVTETWTDRRPSWMAHASTVLMGVRDRGEHNRAGMETTLAQLAAVAEAPIAT